MIIRKIKCAICGREEYEKEPNGGWQGWGNIIGIVFNGEENPTICPEHLNMIADFADSIKNKVEGTNK